MTDAPGRRGAHGTSDSLERLLERFLAWADPRPDIRAVGLVGSGARAGHPADAWSDLDLIVVASDPRPYLDSPHWLADLGTLWVSTVERGAGGEVMERRALFAGGLDLDVIVLSAARAARAMGEMPVAEIVQRGLRVLLDRDGVLSSAAASLPGPPPARPPTAAEFSEAAGDFWFHAAWTAKKLRRGELWTAKSCCDVYMKGLLLRAAAWHTGATRGWDVDTWYNGRFLEEWAAPEVVAALRGIFAHYDPEDVWRALAATVSLFRRLARETADSLSYPYDVSADRSVTAWVERCRREHAAPGGGG